jgi:hypothetical protein
VANALFPDPSKTFARLSTTTTTAITAATTATTTRRLGRRAIVHRLEVGRDLELGRVRTDRGEESPVT